MSLDRQKTFFGQEKHLKLMKNKLAFNISKKAHFDYWRLTIKYNMPNTIIVSLYCYRNSFCKILRSNFVFRLRSRP